MDYPATHPVILSYNKLPCINHFQPPSRPSCQGKPNFKQRFHQLQLVRHDLITGLLVLWGQNYWIQYLVKNAWVLENWPRFRGCTPTLPLCMNLPSSTLRFHLYCCSYAMKPDGRRVNHTIVQKAWPNRTCKETLIISVKLQPNVIHSQLGVISVRNRISRLKKLWIIKPLSRIRHFVDQQIINAWWIRPRMPLKLYIVHMYSDAHMYNYCKRRY